MDGVSESVSQEEEKVLLLSVGRMEGGLLGVTRGKIVLISQLSVY